MNLIEFRKNKRWVKTMRDILRLPLMTQALEMLRENDPLHLQSRNLPYGAAVTSNDHSRLLGLCEGYAMALDYLQSLGKPLTMPTGELTPTFAPPEKLKPSTNQSNE